LREANEHLTPEEILIALRSSRHSEDGGFDKECQAHIDQCSSCAQIREEYKTVLSKLYEFGKAGRSVSGSGCFPPSTWAEIAAGLTSPDETLKHLRHASSCRSCAIELEDALDAVSSSELPSQEIVAQLETGTAEWQHKFSLRMASRGDRNGLRFFPLR